MRLNKNAIAFLLLVTHPLLSQAPEKLDLLPTPECSPVVTVRPDRFTRSTTVSTRMLGGRPFAPVLEAILIGRENSEAPKTAEEKEARESVLRLLPELGEPISLIRLSLGASGTDWQYLGCHPLDLLLDGKPFTVAQAEHSGRVGMVGNQVGVFEYVTVKLTEEQLRQLSQATVLEGRVCNTEFVFPQWFLCDLKGFWSEYEEAKAAASAAMR